jgi:hypothetical protein
LENNKNIRHNKFTDKIKELSRNRKILVFLIFLSISTVLWFLNTLNKEYSTNIEIPLRYTNIPDKNKLADDYTKSLNVEVRGHGYNILQLKLESFSIPVIVNLRKNTPIKTSYNENRFYILSSKLESEIKKRTGSNLNIVDIKPDSLFLNYTGGHHKTVPVVSRAEYSIAGDFILSGNPTLKPDSVTVSGNKNILENIKFVETEKKNLGSISESQNIELKLIQPDKVNYNRSSVQLEINLEKAVETKLNFNITPLNFPKNSKVILIPDKAELTCRMPISIFNNVSEENFSIEADYSERTGNSISLSSKSLNPNIKILKMRPEKVHFLIERR